MSPARIRVRVTKAGEKRYQVVYRIGGRRSREHSVQSAGTFDTQREARTRRDLVAGWLAQGLNPKLELAKLATVEASTVSTPVEWRDRWLASRHDIDTKSEATYRAGLNAVLARLDVADLAVVTPQDCQDTVAKLAADYAPTTVANYWTAFAMLLDYAGHDPNPARHRTVKLPKVRRVPPNVPTREHVEAMLHRLARKYLLPFALLEQTAARVETIEQLAWGSVDIPGARLRLLEKGAKYRFVPMPDWLATMIDATCAPEDRTAERRVFPGVTAGGLRGAMAGACAAAGVPHYSPHDLRHRRASLWHLNAVPDAVLAERLGHEKASFSKDVYAHVMPTEEVPVNVWEAMLA